VSLCIEEGRKVDLLCFQKNLEDQHIWTRHKVPNFHPSSFVFSKSKEFCCFSWSMIFSKQIWSFLTCAGARGQRMIFFPKR